jgi:hypothetical protein
MQDIADSGVVQDQVVLQDCKTPAPALHKSPVKSPGVLEDDVALARLLQEQERAYFFLSM